jgi:hypothetical protein
MVKGITNSYLLLIFYSAVCLLRNLMFMVAVVTDWLNTRVSTYSKIYTIALSACKIKKLQKTRREWVALFCLRL